MTRRLIGSGVATTLGLWVLAGPVLAEEVGLAQPPVSRWISYVVGGCLFAAIVAVSIMSSKRTHQD